MQTRVTAESGVVSAASAPALGSLEISDALLRQARILIIDDQAGVVEVLRTILELDGYREIESTTDPLDAIRLFGEFQPDLVVLDLVMPTLSGWKVLAGLRAIMPADAPVPILVVTSDRTSETRREARSRGASDFVAKPFEPADILFHIRNLLEVRFNGRRQALDAMRASEERFATAFEYAAVGIALMAPGGRWLKVNRSLCDLVGYSEGQLLTRAIQDITHPDDLAATLENMRRLEAGEIQTFRIKNRYVHQGGHLITALVSVSLVRNRQGEPHFSIAQIQDITERERAEAELRWKTAFLEAQVNSSLYGMLVVDLEDKKILQNQLFIDLLQIPKHIVESGNRQDNLRWVTSLAKDPEAFRQKIAYLDAHPHETCREEIEFKSGLVLDRYTAPVLGRDGSHYGRIWMIRDITEQRRAQEELSRSRETLRGVIDHIPQRVFWKDRDSVFIGCNNAFAADIGLRDPAEVAGKTDFETVGAPLAEAYRSADRAVMEMDAPRFSFEEPAFAADGSAMWVRTSKVPLHDRQGGVSGVLGTYEDVTAYKLAKLEIERLNVDLEQRVAQRTAELSLATQEAEQANLAKGEFLSRTSHELRTPMNAILGFSQLLGSEPNLGREARESVERITEAGRQLLTLINELLNVSHAEAGTMALSLEPLAVGPLAEETLCLVRPLAAALDIELQPLPWPECDWRVLADHQRLKQVLMNLLANAVKYNRPGGKVGLDCTRTGTAEFPRARFSVTDTGPGISAENLTRIFIPFDWPATQRPHPPAVDRGFGLALSKRVVELMGGSVGVTSVLEEGSTFWVELPLTDPTMFTVPRLPEAAGQGAAESVQASALLYIEADLANLRLITRVLARRPAVCLHSARTIAGALAMAPELCPDLILLDLPLPESGGRQMLAKLSADPRTAQIPVLILCADSSPQRRAEMLGAGARAYVTKPWQVPTLLREVDRLLTWPSASDLAKSAAASG